MKKKTVGLFSGTAAALALSLAAVPTAFANPMLSVHSTSKYVSQLQTDLNVDGYSSGTVDGIFGPHTLQAVKSFQKAQGLTVDGIVGPKTWAALQAAMPTSKTETTLYVSPSGKDVQSSGTKTHPYQSISYAVKQAAPGSTIVVTSGTYPESLTISKKLTLKADGTVVLNENKQAQGIVVKGMDAKGSVISGFTIKEPADHGIFVQDTSDVTIINNTVTGAVRSETNAKSPKFIAEDKPIELVGASDSIVSGNHVINNNSDGGIGLSDDGKVNPGWAAPGKAMPGNGNTIENNVITNNQGGCGIVVSAYDQGEGVSNNTVIGNTISKGVAGIVVAADSPNTLAQNNTVKNNTVEANGLPGVIVHSNTPGDTVKNTVVTGNTISGNGFFKSKQMGGVAEGIAVLGAVNPVQQTVITNNTISKETVGIGYTENSARMTITAPNQFDSKTVQQDAATVVTNGTPSSLTSGTFQVNVPAPTAVTVNTNNTALILLDEVQPVMKMVPSAANTLPAATSLLTKARQDGVYVVHTGLPGTGGNDFVKGFAPQSNEPVVLGMQDKFHQSGMTKTPGAATGLLSDLRSHNVKNVVIVGGSAANAVQYTALEAMNDGFHVILPEDGIFAASAYNKLSAYNNLLNQAVVGNPTNSPSKGNIVLTTTSKLTLQKGQ